MLPKIKGYSLSIKIVLPGQRTFKSFLCVTDLTVLSPSFFCNVPFDIQNKGINLLDHSALHLDYKYL